jgi:hypothetical protein
MTLPLSGVVVSSGHGRDELLGGEDFEIALGFGVHAPSPLFAHCYGGTSARAVDDGAVLGVVDHLLLGEGIADVSGRSPKGED